MVQESRTAPVPLTMLRFSISPEQVDDGCCLTCNVYLELHQPDIDSPDRVIGICERCGRWYLIDMEPGTDDAVMVLLPELGYFQDVMAG